MKNTKLVSCCLSFAGIGLLLGLGFYNDGSAKAASMEDQVIFGQEDFKRLSFQRSWQIASTNGQIPDPLLVGLSQGAELPDLTIELRRLEFAKRIFEPSDCVVLEGCVAEPGERVLLRFDTAIVNLGEADLVVGDPRNDLDFEFSPCHGHHHFKDFVDYTLYAGDSEKVRTRKYAFCLLDIERRGSTLPRKYTCQNQGIQTGWADVYGKHLDCQWLDITGVPPGEYTLEATVNPKGRLIESNPSNNVTRLTVLIPPSDKIEVWDGSR